MQSNIQTKQIFQINADSKFFYLLLKRPKIIFSPLFFDYGIFFKKKDLKKINCSWS